MTAIGMFRFERGMVSREFSASREIVFDTWLLPDVRKAVLLRNRYKNGVKLLEPYVGGSEHAEDRWRNQLLGEEFRRYVEIERPCLIVSEVTHVTNRKNTPKLLPAPRGSIREVLRFEATDMGSRLTVEVEPLSIRPRWLGPIQKWEPSGWERDLDVFEKELEQRNYQPLDPIPPLS